MIQITEIAYRNGFNDLSYFIRTFKKYKGMTPGKYKRKINRVTSQKDQEQLSSELF